MSQTSAGAAEAADVNRVPRVVIRPRRRLTGVDLGDVWNYRDLLRTFAARDLTLRYRQTALGVVWVFLQPLLAAGVFAFVFGRVAHLHSPGIPYFVFSMAGLLGWNVFNGTVGRTTNSLISAGPMVSKIYFARIILPLSALGSVLIDFCVGLAVLGVLLAGYGISPGWHFAFFPVWLLLMLMLATGVGLVASSVSVRFRDVLTVIPIIMQMLLFMSPVGYDVADVPAGVRWAVGINPLTGILQGFRWSFLGQGTLDPGQVSLSVSVAFLSLAVGIIVFSSLERSFADVI